MKLSTKTLLAGLSVKVLLFSALFFAVSLVLFVFAITFRSQVSNDLGESILVALFVFGSVAILAGIIYVGLSLNIPPEVRYNNSEVEVAKSKGARYLFYVFLVLVVLIPIAIVTINSISKNKEQHKVEGKVDMLVDMHKSSINEFPLLFSDTSQVSSVFSRIGVMNTQTDLNDILLIFKGNISGTQAFIGLGQWDYNETLKESGFSDYIYQCSNDCEYLTSVFIGDELKSFTYCDYGTWYVYRAFESHGQRFVLKFSYN